MMTDMRHKKIVAHHHTGKVVHHRHTSYGSLVVVVLMSLVPLCFISQSVARAAATDPVTGTETTYAVVPGPAPATAPVVTNIAQGAVFPGGEPVVVKGQCPTNTLVKIYKNETFAGATLCQAGIFSITINLFLGTNTLILRAYNTNNIAGPDSSPLVVKGSVLGESTTNPNPSASATGQFFVTSDVFYRGVKVGDPLTWTVLLSGGQAPYAVSVGWGDGKTDLISRGQAGSFDIRHVYAKPGAGTKSSYDVTITATDQEGRKSFIQLVSIVGGDQVGTIANIKKGYDLSGPIRIASQLIVIVVLLILSFWLGERREAFILRRSTGKV